MRRVHRFQGAQSRVSPGAASLGTEEHLYDYLSASGSQAPDAEAQANSFWFNEAATVGSAFLPGGNNFVEKGGMDVVNNILLGPNPGLNMVTGGVPSNDPIWQSSQVPDWLNGLLQLA